MAGDGNRERSKDGKDDKDGEGGERESRLDWLG